MEFTVKAIRQDGGEETVAVEHRMHDALYRAAITYRRMRDYGEDVRNCSVYIPPTECIGDGHQATVNGANYRDVLKAAARRARRPHAYGIGIVSGVGGLQ